MEDGSKVARPQEFLDELFGGGHGMNLPQFLDAREADQIDTVLELFHIVPPTSEVEEIVGEPAKPQRGESAYSYLMRLSADNTGVYFHKRASANRAHDEKAKAWQETSRALAAAGGEPKEGEDVSVSGLLAELELLKKEDNVRTLRQADWKREHEAAEQKRVERSKAITRANAALKDVDRIQRMLTEAQESLRIEQEAAALADKELDSQESICEKSQESLDAAIDLTPEIDDCTKRINDHEKKAEALAERKSLAKQLDRLSVESKQTQAAREAAEHVLDELRELRKGLLAGIDLGVPGFHVGDGELRLGDAPFKQAADSQRKLAAAALAMRFESRFKILRLDGAECLDDESMGNLMRMAHERGWQVWCAKVMGGSKGLMVEVIEN
jgi:predicted CopG family antitoxin